MGKISGKPPLGLHAFPRQLALVVSGPSYQEKKKKTMPPRTWPTKNVKEKKDLTHSDLALYILCINVCKQEKK